jgi:predicted DsbA family dithiol-disulfide isomerase
MDVVCPWCLVGKRRLEAALAQFEHRDEVELVQRSFELQPDAPAVREGSMVDYLANRYGISREEARRNHDNLAALGKTVGIDFRFDLTRGGNSFDAHRLIHYGRSLSPELGDAVLERLLTGYHSEGMPVGDREALTRAAVAAGLDGDAVRELLASDRFAAEVRADEQRGQAIGINGVPFLVLDERYGVSGAQPQELFLEALRKTWESEATPA